MGNNFGEIKDWTIFHQITGTIFAVAYFSVKSRIGHFFYQITGKMPKKRRASLSAKHAHEKRRRESGNSSQSSREEGRIRMENYRAEQESEEGRVERRQSARIDASRLRDLSRLQALRSTEQAVPPPLEPTQK
jgi:hypothetical protein